MAERSEAKSAIITLRYFLEDYSFPMRATVLRQGFTFMIPRISGFSSLILLAQMSA